MKRDMDLIRRMALAIAELPHDEPLTGLEGVDARDFVLHAVWMQEAGLIDAEVQESLGAPPFVWIHRLTWDGCEFADAVRDETLWDKAKEKVIKPASSFSFGVLRDWLKAELLNGLPTLRG